MVYVPNVPLQILCILPLKTEGLNHRVTIERTSPYKESYTVKHPKNVPTLVLGDVDACTKFEN